jgi:cytochrome c-type biogenesis protein CcmE
MTPRRRRLYWVLGILLGVSVATALALNAFKENVMGYEDPTQVAAGHIKTGKRFTLGGMVEQGSLHRTAGSIQVDFVVTDFRNRVAVHYDKVLPDLFREGAGMMAHGRLDANGTFQADEVLAKHDEKYMPPAMARSLQQGQAGGTTGGAAQESR